MRTVCAGVDDVTSEETLSIVADLVDTMRAEGLVGLAAPQLGHNLRIFVMELRPSEKTLRDAQSPLYVCINPEIVESSRELVHEWEGCGSIAHGTLFGRTVRNRQVVLQYQDLEGEWQEEPFGGLLARVAQHELDHLDGILFFQRMEDPTDLYDIEEYRLLRAREREQDLNQE